ncbi:MAG: DEAD/DEAH box helicase [Alphaproteobacteria bacterium]|nr:DEAD/DEAH box helicase [Alphaproteobacteria bacterium]
MEGGITANIEAEPEGLLAARLIEHAASGSAGVIHIARSETRAARLHRAASALAPEPRPIPLPAWDCLPYDRISPSREVMGLRMAAMHRLARRNGAPVLAIASIDAAMQRLPPPSAWASITLRAGERLDPEHVARVLERLGYALEEVADQPGEAAIRGAVLDVFPAASPVPYRVEHAEGRVTEIRAYDPLTQRSRDTVAELRLGPASELPPPDGEGPHPPGMEHALAAVTPGLVSLFDLLPDALLVLDPEVETLRAQRLDDLREAFESVTALGGRNGRPVSPPADLHLDDAAWQEVERTHRVIRLDPAPDEPAGTLPRLSLATLPGFLRERIAAGMRVGIAGPSGPRRAMLRAIGRRLGAEPVPIPGWLALREAPPGTVGLLAGALDAGFMGDDALLIAPADVLGSAAVGRPEQALAVFAPTLSPGDAVIHVDHGMGALRGIETIEQADCLRLAYQGDTSLLVPADEIGRVWRYGAEASSVSLDRLNSESWAKRRAEIEQDIAATAVRLVGLVKAREQATAPVMRARRDAYDRFAARFPFSPTPDQESAIEAVRHDLASGHPMDRLICGDVGYGKTEIALRAAAIAVMAGYQVALAAPTTVLVRQHLITFRRRFAGLGVRVASLSRLTPAAEARETRAGLADGSIGLVIGTQALAGKGVRFKRLGLLIVDEEQRFGVRQKRALRRLGDGVHTLTLTATPIPRTLQGALAGLQQLSVLATPPARRQPVRTIRMEFDPVVVAQALQREARRGGQSFVVCPRIEDIAPMREQLAKLVPQLAIVEVHGEMPPEAMDEAMVRFAEGDGDVLLATNIVEAGLDVPRANTMLIWHPDRFGLAQLHQLRGRVGRSRLRGTVYLLTEPGAVLTPAADKRLDALVGYDRLGAGFAISARDLDLRGAGDLLGEDQAGHVKLIGVDLYRHMLRRALALAAGERPEQEWTPDITLDLPAFVPLEYVQDAALRVELHARLAEAVRGDDATALELLEDEIDDRFGPLPEPVQGLLVLGRLSVACRALGIARLDAGPDAAAVTLRKPTRGKPAPPLEQRGDRLVLPRPSHDAAERVAVAEELLDLLDR